MRGNLGLLVSSADRARLAAIIADWNSPQKHVWRAQVVLMTGDRVGTAEIMRRTGLGKVSVWRWQERYIDEGVDGLLRDKTRPSRIPKLANGKVAEVIRRTQEEAPLDGGTHWTVRAMAAATDVSRAKVHVIWREAGLVPHRWRQFKLSNDPAFAEKVEDAVGALCRSARTCRGAVDRREVADSGAGSDPARPADEAGPARHPLWGAGPPQPRKGSMTTNATAPRRCSRRSTSSTARSSAATCSVIATRNSSVSSTPSSGKCPKTKSIYVILDKSMVRRPSIPSCQAGVGRKPTTGAVHKHPKVRAWLTRHPRWVFHFTPTSASWLNAVEGFFAKLSRRKLERGVFHSVAALQTAINDFVGRHNQSPRPFVWRADPKDIIAAVKRGHQTLEPVQ